MSSNISRSPDFSRYSLAELADVLANIDQTQYPERYAQAKALYEQKLQEQAQFEPPDNDKQLAEPLPKPKWSEQLLITRIVIGAFMLMTITAFPTMYIEFMTAKNWSETTGGLVWLVSVVMIIMWFVCLTNDLKLSQRLTNKWRGKLAIVIMPFLFLMMSWIFIERALPLGLHMIAPKKDVQIEVDYRKRSGRKHCRQRIEIIETNTLENSDLCLSESQRNSLPEQGKITVTGTRSWFGLKIDGFIWPSKKNRQPNG